MKRAFNMPQARSFSSASCQSALGMIWRTTWMIFHDLPSWNRLILRISPHCNHHFEVVMPSFPTLQMLPCCDETKDQPHIHEAIPERLVQKVFAAHGWEWSRITIILLGKPPYKSTINKGQLQSVLTCASAICCWKPGQPGHLRPPNGTYKYRTSHRLKLTCLINLVAHPKMSENMGWYSILCPILVRNCWKKWW